MQKRFSDVPRVSKFLGVYRTSIQVRYSAVQKILANDSISRVQIV